MLQRGAPGNQPFRVWRSFAQPRVPFAPRMPQPQLRWSSLPLREQVGAPKAYTCRIYVAQGFVPTGRTHGFARNSIIKDFHQQQFRTLLKYHLHDKRN